VRAREEKEETASPQGGQLEEGASLSRPTFVPPLSAIVALV